MSAVLEIPPPRVYGNDLAAVKAELNAWGSWIERHKDYEGYPACGPLEAWLAGGGGSPRGHRVLCLDMPVHVYATHARVLLLPEHEKEAVWVYYVPRMKDDGTLWDVREKCLKIGITHECLRKRLQRAYQKILGIE